MKKNFRLVIAALLVLAMAFAFTSCGSDDEVLVFAEALAKTAPAEAKVDVSVETALGILNGTVTTTYNEDGSAVIDYSYEKFNEIGSDDEKSTVKGQITCDKNGTYSGSVSGTVDTAISVKIDLQSKYLKNVAVSEGVLSAIVKAENTAKVLGVQINSDVKIVLFKVEDTISAFTLIYRDEQGAVSIACEYK